MAKKQTRKQARKKDDKLFPSDDSTTTSSPSTSRSTSPRSSPAPSRQLSPFTTPTSSPPPRPAAEMSIRRILVISLGNPGQYENTFHSAGHNVLQAFQRLLQREQPSFSPERIGKIKSLASIGPKYTLLQSPTLMNVSGPWVAKAYREQLQTQGLDPSEVGVVLVHDDLEEELGVIKTRAWAKSHRGHNGVKSVNGALQADPRGKWARVSVGIGRPDERDKNAVSDFVLSKIPRHSRTVIEDKGSSGLLSALIDLETKWGRE